MSIARIKALLAFSLLAVSAFAPASAQTYNFNVYVDTDNSTATGCNVTFANGSVQGAEVHLQATVSAGASPSVISVTRENCSGGVFAGGTVIGGGYPVGVGNGTAGGSVIEFNDTLAALRPSGTGPIRLYVVSTSTLGDDLLLSTTGADPGTPILYTPNDTPIPPIPPTQPAQPAPLIGFPGIALLVGLVLLLGARAARRRLLRRLALLMVAVSGIAWAAGTFVNDGQVTQWAGISPIATDPSGDPTSGENAIDLRAFFAATQSGNVFFRIDVTNINAPAPPVAVNDAYAASANATLVIAAPGVLGNDTVNGATLASHTAPSHGSVLLNADGGFNYTPTTGYTGSDSFTYTLSSSGGSSTATVGFNVVAGPVAVADTYTTTVGTPLTIAAAGVLTNDQLGSPSATLTSFGGGDAGGTITSNAPGQSVALDGAALVLNADGSFTLGAPTAAGTYTFDYRITNSQGTSDGVVTIQVYQAPTISSAATATFVVGTTNTFTVTTTGTPNAVTTESGALPSGVTLVDNGNGTATLAGNPVAGSRGTYPIVLTASNGTAPAASQSFSLIVQQSAAVTSANTTTFTVGTSGAFTVTASGTPGATISETGALPPGVTFNATTQVLSGTPAAGSGGSYSLVFTASNGVGSAAPQNFTLIVDEAPSITSANTATFTIGNPGTFTITTSGFPKAVTGETGALPSGVTLVDNGNGTATLAGTAAAGTGGTYAITLGAANGVGTPAAQSFTLVVEQAPIFTSANTTTFTVGAAGTFTVAAGGVPSPTYTVAGTLPSGVTFNGSSGVLSGTPAAGSGGSYPIVFTASNGIGSPGNQNFTLIINQPPAITGFNTTTFIAGMAASFAITTTGYPNATISQSGTLPTGVTFADNGNGTATLAGTAAVGTGGTYSITISATNGVGTTATQSFNLVVQQAPAITSASTTTFTVGTAGSFNVTATGTPSPSLSETGTLPADITFNAATGLLSGIAGAGTGGSYLISFGANNGVGTAATQNFTLTVDQAPAITSANTATFVAGSAGSFTIVTTGYPHAAISASGSLPSGVTLADNGNGTATLSGTPAAGAGGTYALTVNAANGVGSSATQSFSLVVQQSPTITSANTTTFTVGTAASFPVTASGTPSPTLSETGTLPAGITFNTATGVLGGTAGAGAGGSYSISFGASNGIGTGATQTFTLIIDQAPAITSPATTSFVVGSPASFTITTTGYPSVAIGETGALPSGITLVDNGNGTATLAGTPALGSAGNYSLSLTATNAVGSPAAQSFNLVIKQVPAITSANTTTFTVGTAGSFAVTASGSPAPVLSVSGTLPSGVTFNTATGSLAGTAATGTGGNYPLVFTANNGVTPNATQNFTLIVDQAPALTSATSTSFVVGSAGTFTISTSGFPTPTISKTGTLPAGVTLVDNGNGTATLAGTPTAGSGGTYPITLSANNGVGSAATQGFNLVVQQSASITSANTATFTAGTTGSFTVTTTGTPAPTLSETGTLPTGITFNTGTGVLAGTPGAGTGGSYPITIGANNGVGTAATQNFTLIVDQAPAITSTSATTFTIGSAGAFTVTASGYPASTFSESGTLPSGIAFSSAGVLSGTPAAGTAGSYPITITATNGVGSPASQSFTVTVLSPCTAITISGTLPNGSYQTAYSSTFAQTGGTAPITWSATGLPSGLTINPATGVVSGTPATTVASASVTIGVTDVNGCPGSKALTGFKIAPIASDDSYNTVGNTPLQVGGAAPATPYVASSTAVFANDSGPGTLSTTATTLATTRGGSVTIAANGSFVYTPKLNDTGATDTFTYTLTDGNGVASAPATVSIAIAGMVWYVDGSVATNGNGESVTPFNTLASASTAHAAGNTIFVKSGGTATTTPGAISLKANSTLWGQGSSLPTISGISIQNTGATTKPKLTGTVTLAGNGVTVSSLDISTGAATGFTNTGTTTGGLVENSVTVTTTSGTAVSLNNAGGTLTFQAISSNGAASGILVSNTTGTFSVTGVGTTAGSGGTLANSTANAANSITLNAVASASFSNMIFQNASSSNLDYGINAVDIGTLVVANSAFSGMQQKGVYLISSTTNTTGGSFNIHDNSFTGIGGSPISLDFKGSSTFIGHVKTNTIGNQTIANSGSLDDDGIYVLNEGSGTDTVDISNNTISQIKFWNGIDAVSLATGATVTNHLNLTIANNTINMVSTASDDGVTVHQATAGATLCLNATGNHAAGAGLAAQNGIAADSVGISLEFVATAVFQVQGAGSPGTNTTALMNYLNANNTLSGPGGGSIAEIAGASGFTSATCAIAP